MVDIFKSYIRFMTLGKVCLELISLSVAVAVIIFVRTNMLILCTKYDNGLPDDLCNNYRAENSDPSLTSQLNSPSPTPISKGLSSEDAFILHSLQRMHPLAIVALVFVAIDMLLNTITTALLINKDDEGRLAVYQKNWYIVLIIISMFSDINQLMMVITQLIICWPVRTGMPQPGDSD